MKRTTVELLAAAVFAGLFAYLFVEATGYRGRSSYMPMAASGCGSVMCALWAIGQLRARGATGPDTLEATRSDFLRFLFILAVAVIYVAAFALIGFFTSTLIMVPALAYALGYRRTRVMTITAGCFCLVIYAVFRLLLSIPLPDEAILQLFGA